MMKVVNEEPAYSGTRVGLPPEKWSLLKYGS